MRPTKSQFITRIRKAQSRLATIKESPRCYKDFGPSDKSHLIGHKHGAVVNDSDSSLIEIRSNRANTFLEQKNEDGLVRQILTYNNYTRALQSR